MTTAKPWWRRALERVGVGVRTLEELRPTFDAELAAAGRYIFVHDDSVSRMDQVTKWLEQSFGLEQRDAAMKMVGIHHHGWGVLGPFTPEEAVRLAERARRCAAELGLEQLRFSREPPS